MTIPQLDTIAIGWPITRLGVSFFPVVPARQRPAGDRHRRRLEARRG